MKCISQEVLRNIPHVDIKRRNFLNQENAELTMTKQEVKIMTEQLQKSNQKRIWVDKFDEEDWEELFRSDLWEPFEDDKAFMRVIQNNYRAVIKEL